MYIGLWGFLSISMILTFIFAIFVIYIDFKKKQMYLETEAQKNKEMTT